LLPLNASPSPLADVAETVATVLITVALDPHNKELAIGFQLALVEKFPKRQWFVRHVISSSYQPYKSDGF
jgi:hypothetical protein